MSIEANRQTIPGFNKWAKTYNEGRLTRWLRRGQEKILEALCLNPCDSLLDVGCGTGWAVIRAADRLPHGRACGIDLSREMILRASENSRQLVNTHFQLADAEMIPYQDCSFDAVLCTHSFHHYSNPTQALKEIHRVTKPGGRFFLLDSTRDRCVWVWFLDRVHRIFEKGHVRYYSQPELFDLLRKGGFPGAALVHSEHLHFQSGKIGWAVSMIRGDKLS